MTKRQLATLAAIITISTGACSHTQLRTKAPIASAAADSPASSTGNDPKRLQSASGNSAPGQISSTTSAATLQYLQIAKFVFPTQDTSTLIRTGHAICSNLANNPSLHDTVGDLTAQTGNQASAQHLVQAVITAYCPGTAAHSGPSRSIAPRTPPPRQ